MRFRRDLIALTPKNDRIFKSAGLRFPLTKSSFVSLQPAHLLPRTELNYLNWFAREGFPPGKIGRLLAVMQGIDHNGLRDLLVQLRASRHRRD